MKEPETNTGDPIFKFKHIERERTFDKPIYLGDVSLEVPKNEKKCLTERFFDILQHCYGQNNLKIHYRDKYSFI